MNDTLDHGEGLSSASDGSAEAARWLAEFERRNGRRLRVLHIGNIANNAYRNAAIQRAAGIDADVVCYDYYHIMGCPEWEEAQLSGNYDADFPDWWTISSTGFRRPDWFIQGPRQLCLEHLRARRAGDPGASSRTRLALIQAYSDILDARAGRSGAMRRDILAPQHRRATALLAPEFDPSTTRSRLTGHAEAVRQRATRFADPLWRDTLIHYTANDVAEPALRRQRRGETAHVLDRQRLALAAAIRRRAGLAMLHESASKAPAPAHGLPTLAARLVVGLALSRVLRPLRLKPPTGQPESVPHAQGVVVLRDDLDAIADHYRRAPFHTSQADVESDLALATATAAPWRDILAGYDIVQGYSIDGLIPLFAGHPRFVAYEHGTIRAIPFEDTSRGRLCRFTYSQAPRVLITNTDVLPSADRIPIAPHRRRCIPHAFDDARLLAFRRSEAGTIERPARLTIFSPARHHWEVFDPSLGKGNDTLLRGAALAADEGIDFELVLIEWGQQVAASRRLIDELGITDRVRWLAMMNRKELWRMYLQSHAVADQFSLAALGGVGYEALTLGTRLITNLDASALATFFGACPPAFIADTPQAVAASIRTIAADPLDQAGRGAAAAEWARRYHSTARLHELQVGTYRDLLQCPEGPRDAPQPARGKAE